MAASFFSSASFKSSFCMLNSANIFFRRRFSSSMIFMSAHIGQYHAAFNLAQNTHDLGFRKSALPHQNLLVVLFEKILPSKALSLGEDYPPVITPKDGVWSTLAPGATVAFSWTHAVDQAEMDRN
jgi:hypothetical protein